MKNKIIKSIISTGEIKPCVMIERNNKKAYGIAPSGSTTGETEKPTSNESDEFFDIILKRIDEKNTQEKFDTIMQNYGSDLSTASSMAFYKTEEHPINGIPRIICNVINAGKHTGEEGMFCEFMIVPEGKNREEDILIVAEAMKNIKPLLEKKGVDVHVHGREGGFVPRDMNNEQILDLIQEATKLLKCNIAIDCAGNNFARRRKDDYDYKFGEKRLTSKEAVKYYQELIRKYDIAYLEDPFHEKDTESWKELRTTTICMIVADDLTTTNKERITELQNCFDAVILKPNQCGTITQTKEAYKACVELNKKTIVSQRSGENDDDTIVTLACELGSDFLKAGSPTRERIVKYNSLLRNEARYHE